MQRFDVILVGKGNAALCAALAAREGTGARVVMLEAAPVEESGGNSRFAGGMMRFAFNSVEDLKLLTEIPDDEVKNTDWDTNTTDEFYDDLYRLTSFRTDPRLSEIMITKSLEAMVWLRRQGVRFVPNYRAASAVVEGRRKFSWTRERSSTATPMPGTAKRCSSSASSLHGRCSTRRCGTFCDRNTTARS